MDGGMITPPSFTDKLIVVGIALACFIGPIFFLNGVYCAFWNVPAKRTQIAELTDSRDAWQARAKELEKYIEVREGQYRVATKCSQFFMMIANSKQILGMEGVEELIKSKKAFFKPAKTKGE